MARRDRGFGWVREDVEGEATQTPERTPRREHRAERERHKTLVLQLLDLPAGARQHLPISAATRDALTELKACPTTPARKRLLLRVATMIAGEDLEEVEAALAGDTPQARRLAEAERWRARLLAGEQADLHAFIASHPGVEVQPLRHAWLQARRGGAPAKKAARRLFELLRDAPEGDTA